MTSASRAVRRVTPAARRPDLPGHGDRGYDVAALRPRPDLQGRPATGWPARRRLTRRRHRGPRRVRPRPAGLRVSKVTVDGAAPAQYTHRRGKLLVAPATRSAGGRALVVAVQYAGSPQPLSAARGRGRLGGAHRRRDRRRPADGGAVLVPLQRPARRQGELPDRGHRPIAGTTSSPTACSPSSVAGQHDDLGLRAARADGDLPRHRADRPLRDARAGRRRRCAMLAVLPQRLRARFDARLRPAAAR